MTVLSGLKKITFLRQSLVNINTQQFPTFYKLTTYTYMKQTALYGFYNFVFWALWVGPDYALEIIETFIANLHEKKTKNEQTVTLLIRFNQITNRNIRTYTS